jgi:hypothetical protein
MDWVSFDEWNLMGVDSLATDPVDPNRLYILAGTYTNEWTNMNGVILRSSDRGNSFQRTSLPFKSGGNMPGRSMGERLAIDPNRNSTIYLGARSGNGLWRSTDFGANWSRVLSFTALGTYVQQAGDVYLGDTDGVVWVTFDPRTGSLGNATQRYVGVADKGNSVFRMPMAVRRGLPYLGNRQDSCLITACFLQTGLCTSPTATVLDPMMAGKATYGSSIPRMERGRGLALSHPMRPTERTILGMGGLQ